MTFRKLVLTSPLTHGDDVKALQRALNSMHGQALTIDGQFGPTTQHAVKVVSWDLGLGRTDAVPAIQKIIRGLRLRSPADLVRAKSRAKAAKKNVSGLAGIVHNALLYVGVHESPPGSNAGRPNPEGWENNFAMGRGPWCGAFSGSMMKLAGFHPTSRVVYTPNIVNDAKTGLNGFDKWVAWDGDLRQVGPGWLVLFDWTGRHSGAEHVGIVRQTPAGGSVATVEGNTGGTNPSDGGMVAENVRPLSFVIGFARPRA